jgi:hypothetical protein
VLVEEVDNKAVPKIIDFGLAKAAGQRLTEMTMFTEAGAMAGYAFSVSCQRSATRRPFVFGKGFLRSVLYAANRAEPGPGVV